MRPACTAGRSTTAPTVAITVSGASGIAHPQALEYIPSEVTPTAGPNVAAMRGLLAATLIAVRRMGPGSFTSCAVAPLCRCDVARTVLGGVQQPGDLGA